jgi:hypothetical protein
LSGIQEFSHSKPRPAMLVIADGHMGEGFVLFFTARQKDWIAASQSLLRGFARLLIEHAAPQ